MAARRPRPHQLRILAQQARQRLEIAVDDRIDRGLEAGDRRARIAPRRGERREGVPAVEEVLARDDGARLGFGVARREPARPRRRALQAQRVAVLAQQRRERVGVAADDGVLGQLPRRRRRAGDGGDAGDPARTPPRSRRRARARSRAARRRAGTRRRRGAARSQPGWCVVTRAMASGSPPRHARSRSWPASWTGRDPDGRGGPGGHTHLLSMRLASALVRLKEDRGVGIDDGWARPFPRTGGAPARLPDYTPRRPATPWPSAADRAVSGSRAWRWRRTARRPAHRPAAGRCG